MQLVGGGKTLGLMIKQTRDLAGDLVIITGPEILYPDAQEAAGDALYNIWYMDINFDYSKEPLKSFREKYIKRFGREPSPDSVVGYNALTLPS